MEVIPVPATDRQHPIGNIRTRTFFVFDTRLDESTLRSALDDLIRNHWRKLGGRLVPVPGTKNGSWEYHVPETFDDRDESKYKLFEWSRTEFDHVIDESAPLQFFHDAPAADKGVTVLQSFKEVDDLVRPATWPLGRADESAAGGGGGGAPLLYVHLSFFTDATVVALSWPHVLADQMGIANIMRAWFGLAYKNETPPEMIGYNEDVLSSSTARKDHADYPPNEIYRKGCSRVRNKWEYFFVALGFVPEFIFDRTEQSRILFFPRPMLEGLKERYRKELTEQYGSDPGLSCGDIINAILTKFARMHDKKSRTLTLSQLVNLRGRHETLASLPRQRSYIHNALHYTSARFRLTPTTPLREIAYQNRLGLKTQTTPSALEIGLAVMREQVRRGQGTHICEPLEKSYFVTNWCLAWKGLEDIIPTAVPTSTPGAIGEKTEENDQATTTTTTTTTASVKPRMMVLGHSMEKGTPSRFNSTVMCQTPEGFWCDFTAIDKGWKLIEEYLETDPLLENF